MGLNPISWLLPSTAVSFHHSPESISLPLKKGSSSIEQEKAQQSISLSDLCKAATPEKCQLNPLLFNGHLQTAYTVVKNVDVPIHYKRKIFEAENAVYSGQFAIDFVVEPYEKESENEKAKIVENEENDGGDTAAHNGQMNKDLPTRTTFYTDSEFASLPSTDTKPMLVALHGLSGGSHELYLRHVLAPLVKSGGDGDGGWEACVVNSRGCAESKITTGVLYNARATWDVRQAVRWLRKKFPNRPLFGIGFSLGANILTNVRILDMRGKIGKIGKIFISPVLLFSENVLILTLSCFCFIIVVPRRRRLELPPQRRRNLLQPVELGDQLYGSAAVLDRHGDLLEDDGNEYEKAVRGVRVPLESLNTQLFSPSE